MVFQNRVNSYIPSGWHGDFATTNTRISFPGTGGQYQAGKGGVNAGSFVWIDDATGTLVNKGTGAPVAFVSREGNGLITQYLEEYSRIIPAGFMVTAYAKADFWVNLSEDFGNVTRGESVFTDPTTGEVVASSASGAIETNYKYAGNASGGEMVQISAWI